MLTQILYIPIEEATVCNIRTRPDVFSYIYPEISNVKESISHATIYSKRGTLGLLYWAIGAPAFCVISVYDLAKRGRSIKFKKEENTKCAIASI